MWVPCCVWSPTCPARHQNGNNLQEVPSSLVTLWCYISRFGVWGGVECEGWLNCGFSLNLKVGDGLHSQRTLGGFQQFHLGSFCKWSMKNGIGSRSIVTVWNCSAHCRLLASLSLELYLPVAATTTTTHSLSLSLSVSLSTSRARCRCCIWVTTTAGILYK